VARRRFFKALFDPEARAWQTVQHHEDVYARYELHHPDLEPYQLLGHLRETTRKTRRRAKDPALHKPAFVATYIYASVPPPDGARALGLWILLNTRPTIAEKYPSLGQEYNRLVSPVFEAQQNGELHALYARYNPKLAKQTQWQSE